MKKLGIIAAMLVAATGINTKTVWADGCFSSLVITTYGTQVICPNSANERTVTKEGTFIISIPTDGCRSGTSTGGGVGGGFLQGGGGGLPGSSPTPIAPDQCVVTAGGPGTAGGDGGNPGVPPTADGGSPNPPDSGCGGDTNRTICEPCPTCTSSSVLVTNGTYTFEEIDLAIPAKGMNVELRRTYRSNRILPTSTNPVFAEPADGPLGYGWMTPFFVKIVNGDTFIDADGRYYQFKKDAAGNFLTDTASGLSLKKTATGFELKKLDAFTRVFDSNGKLLSKSDNNGNTWTMSYDSTGTLVGVIDAAVRTVLVFTYDGSHIIKAEDNAGRTVHYDYDGFGNMLSYTDAASNVYSYTYNSNHGLTSKTNPLNETATIEYQYPDKGVVGKVIDPIGTALRAQGQPTTGHEQTFVYDFGNKTFYITDKNGRESRKTVNEKGLPTSEEEVATGKTLKKIEYLQNRIVKTTDEAGNTVTVQKDEWGNVLSRIDGEGSEWKYTYAAGNRLTNVIHPDGRVDKYEYDTKGNLLNETLALGLPEEIVTIYNYNSYGQLESKSFGGAVISYIYNAAGQLLTTTDPLGNITTLEYDQYGNAKALIDANGNRTEFTYDVLGNLREIKDPLEYKTTYAYNAVSRLVSIKDALNRTTQFETDFKGRTTAIIDPYPLIGRKDFEYDGNGNLVKITEGTAVTLLSYDTSNRLASLTDAEGNTTTYEYASASTACTSCGGGSLSSPAKVRDSFGYETEYGFDKNGRVNLIKDPLAHLESVTYDSGGRVKSKKDANGYETSYEYDALGRVLKQKSAIDGEEISYRYEKRGNLVSLTDPNGHDNTFEYDLADRKTKETRPLGQVIEYTYYPNGLLHTVKDGKGQINTYTYDAASRLTNITYVDGKEDNFTYDEVGNLKTYSNNDVNGSFAYDAKNRKLSETVNYGPFSKSYSYTYDSRGNKATYTSPESVIYNYTYNQNNQPTSIAFNGNSISFEYDKTRLRKTTFPNGITTDYQYNANSWLTYITTKQGTTTNSDYQYGFDNNGNITTKNTEHGNYTYSYDNTYQLTTASSPSLQESFTYDGSGNRLTDNSSIPGNLNYGLTEYNYNSQDRLESVNLPDGKTATYYYDPFGRRIMKDVAGQITYFNYSDEGLIGEYDSSGNVIRAYGWRPDGIWGTAPLFMVENGSYYFYQNDFIGTPQRLTDIYGNSVWNANYDAFGAARIQTATVTNNFRFPGQYYDIETGLSYNLTRYYNSSTGKYIQIDPIGFSSGELNLYRYSDSVGKPLTETNLYLYTGNSPVNRIDPLGLDWTDDVTNFSAGLGDALLLGTGQYLRDQLGIGGVDRCSKAYKYGSWSSFALGAARLGYAGLAKGASIIAASGLEASMYRESLKKVFRLGLGANFRSPNLAKYGTDEALRAAAGRTNPYINSYGAGIAAAGTLGGSGCGCRE